MPLVYGPSLVLVPIIVWRHGFQTARFFLAGWSLLAVSALLLPFVSRGWLPGNHVAAHLVMIGSALEMILFAPALANSPSRWST